MMLPASEAAGVDAAHIGGSNEIRERLARMAQTPEGRAQTAEWEKLDPDDLICDGERRWLGLPPRRGEYDENGNYRPKQTERWAVHRTDEASR
jgi:hypothetical protein